MWWKGVVRGGACIGREMNAQLYEYSYSYHKRILHLQPALTARVSGVADAAAVDRSLMITFGT